MRQQTEQVSFSNSLHLLSYQNAKKINSVWLQMSQRGCLWRCVTVSLFPTDWNHFTVFRAMIQLLYDSRNFNICWPSDTTSGFMNGAALRTGWSNTLVQSDVHVPVRMSCNDLSMLTCATLSSRAHCDPTTVSVFLTLSLTAAEDFRGSICFKLTRLYNQNVSLCGGAAGDATWRLLFIESRLLVINSLHPLTNWRL